MEKYFEDYPINEGVLYLLGNTPPPSPSEAGGDISTSDSDDDDNGTFTSYTIENKGSKVIFERVLADSLDPGTPPKTKTVCVKTCRADFPPISTCCGWKTQFKHYYNRYTLVVTLKEPKDIKKIVEDCLVTGAVVAALSAIMTNGAGAIAAGEAAIYACLETKIAEELLTVKIKRNGRWGNWG